MSRHLILRLSRRRAISTIIAGLIMLSLVLTSLGTMVFVSQQYDQYQQTAYKMGEVRDQGRSENLVSNAPGLTANLAWAGCGGCNMYNMSLSNLGGVGVQIARIYITTTISGSTPLLILTPSSSSTSYAFQQSKMFLNAGETNHAVLLFLPNTITLPVTYPPPTTVVIVTSRGSEFSFQWPSPIQVGGQSQSAFSVGTLKIAYQCSNGPTCGNPGYDSKNEPGVAGGNPSGQYCHKESSSSSPKNEQPQKFTGITYNGSPILDSGTLWFVNPWITQTILTNTCSTTEGCSANNQTNLYFYVNITNTWTSAYTVAGGSLDLTWYGSNHISGALIGFYDSKGFHTLSSGYVVSPNNYFYGIFRAYAVQLTSLPASSLMFWGSLSITNNVKDSTFISGVQLSSGLWVRYSC